MQKAIPTLTLLILLLSATAAASASSTVPGEVLVKYRAGKYPRHLQGSLAKIGWAKITIGANETKHSAVAALSRQSDIEQVEPNTRGEFLAVPDDPRFPEQRYLPAIKAPEAWEKSLGAGVIVGLVDSGVDLDHEDLADNILPNGWDFGDDDDSPGDELGHGTQVCGIIAAVQNNGLLISGVAPQSKILPLKISEGSTDIFTDETVAEAIVYAADSGAAVINLSLGWNDNEDHAAVTDAITYAADKGVTLVAAAGNRYGPVWFPAKLEKVVAVSAIDSYDQNDYSGYGPELDLVAPGSGRTLDDFILTTASGGGYTFNKGTSLSAAMVSGVAALLLSEVPHLTNDQVVTYLTSRADDLGKAGRDDEYGYGRVNALSALDPLISFVFPSRIAGGRTMPLVYLMALFGYDTHFFPLFSRVSFSSAYLSALGPPVIAIPRLLLQLVMLKPDAPEGFIDITVTTGNEDTEGFDAVYINRPRLNALSEEKRLQTK